MTLPPYFTRLTPSLNSAIHYPKCPPCDLSKVTLRQPFGTPRNLSFLRDGLHPCPFRRFGLSQLNGRIAVGRERQFSADEKRQKTTVGTAANPPFHQCLGAPLHSSVLTALYRDRADLGRVFLLICKAAQSDDGRDSENSGDPGRRR